jgi:hypothetical protein
MSASLTLPHFERVLSHSLLGRVQGAESPFSRRGLLSGAMSRSDLRFSNGPVLSSVPRLRGVISTSKGTKNTKRGLQARGRTAICGVKGNRRLCIGSDSES